MIKRFLLSQDPLADQQRNNRAVRAKRMMRSSKDWTGCGLWQSITQCSHKDITSHAKGYHSPHLVLQVFWPSWFAGSLQPPRSSIIFPSPQPPSELRSANLPDGSPHLKVGLTEDPKRHHPSIEPIPKVEGELPRPKKRRGARDRSARIEPRRTPTLVCTPSAAALRGETLRRRAIGGKEHWGACGSVFGLLPGFFGTRTPRSRAPGNQRPMIGS